MSKGLIPLMLSPNCTASFGTRSSSRNSGRASISPPVSPPVQPSTHRRYASDVTPTIKLSRPPVRTAPRRQSQQAPISQPVARAYSSEEWKKTIAEIKRYHVTRRFRACLARCNEVLSSVRNHSTVEPAYLIYLHFYAAMSLELCARPLAPASAYRISLLQQARDHYSRAADLIRTAEDAAVSQSRSSSAASSSLPSLHSPSGSVSSRAWTPDCVVATPTSAVCRKSSMVQDSARTTGESPCRRPNKKKVSFELPKDRTQWPFTLPEPIIRPDSPTLGMDDEYFAAGAMRQELPELPLVHHKRSVSHELEVIAPMPRSSSPLPMPVISEGEELSPTTESSPSCSEEADYPFYRYDIHHHHAHNSYVESARALSRYCETLSTLSRQVARHTVALDALLAEDLRGQQLQQLPGSPMVVLHDPHQHHRKASSISSGSLLPVRSSSSLSFASSGEDAQGEEDRRERLDRLRMSGWKRQRFDGTRYAQLCDAVMAELSQA